MSIQAVIDGEQQWHVEVGDVMAGLQRVPAGVVQTVVTSPPYWNLRSYLKSGDPNKVLEIGSEKTPSDFVNTMVGVFREVRRVLRDDGTLWLNLGDSYATAGGKCFNPSGGDNSLGQDRKSEGCHPLDRGNLSDLRKWGVQDGDQLLMPHRVAMALQADGWILRSTIIWAKKSPMPESISGWRWRRCRVKDSEFQAVRYVGKGTEQDLQSASERLKLNMATARSNGIDHKQGAVSLGWKDCPGCEKCRENDGYVLRRGKWRPTTGHEYIFLFAKSDQYFCDGDAVKEACSTNTHSRGENRHHKQGKAGVERANGSYHAATAGEVETRNPRSVWILSSEPEKAKHFATFPSEIPRKCITASTSQGGCCPQCGASYAPVVESERIPTRPGHDNVLDDTGMANRDPQRHIAVTRSTGYRPTCRCNAGKPVPSIVLDPFSGSGTTGRVAYSMGLRYIGFELSQEYAEISHEKIVRPFKTKAVKRVPNLDSQAQPSLF